MGTWYDEAVFYHIYPLGMTGAPKENRGEECVHRLRSLSAWLPHLVELGVTAVYLGPLFESSTHGYDTIDYRQVDRRLGDNADLREFVRQAHEKNIRVVLDGVFNHTGRAFFAFQDILRNRESSPFCCWYKGLHFGWDAPYNDGICYEAWRNCFELVNLNLYEPAVREYLFDTVRFWIEEFDIDGIRLDCADCLPFEFMRDLRQRTGRWKSDFWLMGEVIHGDYGRWLGDDMLHSVTNYELHKALYSGHNDHNYFEIAHTIRRQFGEEWGICRGKRLYAFVDNHDVDRLMSKLNNKDQIRSVYTLLYTLPGIPSVYYGSEWGIEGRKQGGNDDPLRPALNLEEMERQNPHPELTEHIRALGKIKRENADLLQGRYRELLLTNRQYAFARILDNRAVVVAANNDEQPADLRIPLPVNASHGVDLLTGEEIVPAYGTIALRLAACGSAVLRLA